MKEILMYLIPSKLFDNFMRINQLYLNYEYDKLFDEFNRELQLDEFYDKNEFVESLEEEDLGINDILFWYLEKNDILLQLDWSGEDNKRQVEEFINKRLKDKYNVNERIDTKEVYEYFDKTELKRGEHLIVLFKYLNKQLNKLQFNLVIFDIGTDSYFITFVPQKVFDKVNDFEADGIRIQNNNILM